MRGNRSDMTPCRLTLCSLLAALLQATVPALASAQESLGMHETASFATGAGSSAYPRGDFQSHLAAASGDAPDACDWGWGCGGSPFRPGPGECDNFRVGPNWHGSVEGLFLFRDDVDINALAGAANAGGVALPINAGTLTSNFDHGAGVRLSLWAPTNTGWGSAGAGYEVQVDYLGIYDWDAEAFNPDVPPPGPIGPDPADTIVQRSLSYESSLHSLAVNMQSIGDERLKLFTGVRYVRLAEDVSDFYDETSPRPALPDVPLPDLELTDVLRNVAVKNNLIGFQGGVRSDLFSLGERFYLSGFANAGAYCNLIQRRSRLLQVDSFVRADDPATPDDPATLNVDESSINEAVSITQSGSSGYKSQRVRMSMVTEASLSAVYKINRCTQAQLGYQVFYINGVELGDEAFLGATPTSSDLILHGWFAGVEYRR